MALLRYAIGITIAALTLLSCDDGTSLQRYLVDKQEDDKFVKVDIATSLLQSDESNFTEEQQEILNTIKKVNVVAYPLKGGNMAEYETEMQKLSKIIDQEKYILLSSINSNGTKATLKYLGDEQAIDEVIIFAKDDERGFAVFRLLGDDMKPGQMVKLLTSIDSGDLDVSALSGIGELFADDDFKTEEEVDEEIEQLVEQEITD